MIIPQIRNGAIPAVIIGKIERHPSQPDQAKIARRRNNSPPIACSPDYGVGKEGEAKNVGKRDSPAKPTSKPISQGRFLPVVSTSAAMRKKTADTWASIQTLPSVAGPPEVCPEGDQHGHGTRNRKLQPSWVTAIQKKPTATAPTSMETIT